MTVYIITSFLIIGNMKNFSVNFHAAKFFQKYVHNLAVACTLKHFSDVTDKPLVAKPQQTRQDSQERTA
jgi:hypothetical protein